MTLHGTIDEIITALELMRGLFGQGASIHAIQTAQRYVKLDTIVKNQFGKEKTNAWNIVHNASIFTK